MFGTIVNAAAIVVGGLIGLFFKKGFNKNIEEAVHKALGLSVLILGLNGVISAMFTINGDKVESAGELLLIVSLVLGVILGELLKIEDRLNHVSYLIERKMNLSGFASGFVTGTILYCVGAMAIIGALNDGLKGDSSILFIKSLLDGIAAIVLGATLGSGIIFSSISVFLYQGAISCFAWLVEPYLAGELLTQICMVGYAVVMCIGINFLGFTKIKTANMLPALLIPIVYYFIKALIF